MTRRLLGGAVAAAAVFALVTAPAANAATTSFSGAVALSNCSGSVVKPADTPLDAPALVLSNGHCLESGFPEPGQVITDQSSDRTFDLLSEDGQSSAGTVQAKKVVYATMTDTDVSLYQLTDTYAGIKDKYGVAPLELVGSHPEAGTAIDVVSGYWKKIYSCGIDGFVHELHEGDWVWKDSIRYTPGCDTIGGTSGSPIVDHETGKVIGVNNTANEDGQRCTENNPCEVDESGNVEVKPGTKYGEETYGIPACLTPASEVDLDQQGCALPKP
ncbi:S1 family peptidase [Amycolatopsis jiangsuensis]|uniref:V8-like Glu-specific endopeptidase n=1 Tax=Amycolatopsis jiangsuensis TaxID=1181879 RepID=A0A840J1F2_9PSEU|nr:serine protease [Amycolatopsis jiangsuensis]MBB4687753.1 V8-like Glu-specific endopeptidase [Amycolatopsis jiangsuensis]